MRLFRVAVIVGSAALALAGCDRAEQQQPGARREQQQRPTVQVTLATSRLQPVQRSIEVVGTLFGDEEAQISAKVSGRVAERMVDIGDRVPAGAPLAQIDRTDYELALRQSESMLLQTLSRLGLAAMPSEDFDPSTVPTVRQAALQAENAQSRFARSEKLFKEQTPLISEQEYEDARTTAQVARAAYDVALLAARSLIAEAKTRQAEIDLHKKRLADATVRAPDGRPGQTFAVAQRTVSVGEYVKDGTPLFRLIADDPIRFRAAVPERFLSAVRVDQPVTLRVEAYDRTFEGTVARINPQVERESRTFEVEAAVANADGLLRPGAFASGSIATHVEESVTFVPRQAVVSFAGVHKVFTVAEGKAIEHEVATGVVRDGYIEITRGLTGGPEVVVGGANRLANNNPVEVRPAGAATEPATRPAR